jgi:hypothetical protein
MSRTLSDPCKRWWGHDHDFLYHHERIPQPDIILPSGKRIPQPDRTVNVICRKCEYQTYKFYD